MMTLAQDPQTGFFNEMRLSMKWMVDSKGNDRCRGAKFRWTLNRYESLKNACRNSSHEWTRRLNRAWRTNRMRRKKRSIRSLRRKMRTRRMKRMRRMRR